MSQVMMAYGGHAFSLTQTAYDKVVIKAKWRWPEAELVGRHADLQFTGPGPKQLKFSGVMFPAAFGGVARLAALRTMGDAGQARSLVDGHGNHWGLYVLESLKETRTALTMQGAPRKQTWEMSLRYFGARSDGADFEL